MSYGAIFTLCFIFARPLPQCGVTIVTWDTGVMQSGGNGGDVK